MAKRLNGLLRGKMGGQEGKWVDKRENGWIRGKIGG
jgi:hypothetical protein